MLRFTVMLVAVVLIAACNPVPSKQNQSGYTKALVRDAIRLYDDEGLETTIAALNNGLDGQWYVFILDETSTVIAHYDPDSIGNPASQIIDADGAPIGHLFDGTPPEGKWIFYPHHHPQTGVPQMKHAWIILHDGLIFGSGWYEDE